MGRRKRLKSIEQVAEYAEAASARQLAERLRALNTEERRLEQLAGYLAEYEQQARGAQRATSLGALRSRRSFIERLRGAVTEQHGVVETQRCQAEQQTGQWRAARAHSLAMQRLGERVDQRERERRERREQATLDEIGLNQNGRQHRR